MTRDIALYLREFSQFFREVLPVVETSFNAAGFLPIVHRVSGGVRMVYGVVESIAALALSILICNYGYWNENGDIKKEGWKMLDFAVHGLKNIFRGFVECHDGFYLICPLHDYFVQAEKASLGLRYDRPIFK